MMIEDKELYSRTKGFLTDSEVTGSNFLFQHDLLG